MEVVVAEVKPHSRKFRRATAFSMEMAKARCCLVNAFLFIRKLRDSWPLRGSHGNGGRTEQSMARSMTRLTAWSAWSMARLTVRSTARLTARSFVKPCGLSRLYHRGTLKGNWQRRISKPAWMRKITAHRQEIGEIPVFIRILQEKSGKINTKICLFFKKPKKVPFQGLQTAPFRCIIGKEGQNRHPLPVKAGKAIPQKLAVNPHLPETPSR